jgi:putative cardiolipin synthase
VFDRKACVHRLSELSTHGPWIHNTEIGVVFNSEELATEMAKRFDANIEKFAFRLELVKGKSGGDKLLWHGIVNGKPVTFTSEPYASFWQKFGAGFMRILPIEGQL